MKDDFVCFPKVWSENPHPQIDQEIVTRLVPCDDTAVALLQCYCCVSCDPHGRGDDGEYHFCVSFRSVTFGMSPAEAREILESIDLTDDLRDHFHKK